MRTVPLNHVRRALLVKTVQVGSLTALLAMAARSTPAVAKAAKGDFLYQNHAHDGKSCGLCRFFVPEDPNKDIGTCSIVEGSVSRGGWCLAYAPRNNGDDAAARAAA